MQSKASIKMCGIVTTPPQSALQNSSRHFGAIVRALFVGSLLTAPSALASPNANDLANAALARTAHAVTYDGAYFAIDYPNGDIPEHLGVCTDVVIRSYRALGIDLQRLVHEDMRSNFSDYPSQRIWGLSKPDHNIDHRRVPNLQRFFSRHGDSLGVSSDAKDFRPGDIVTWMLPGNLPHIGIIANQRNEQTGHPLIVHNIGKGPVLEDQLFTYKITGHYRYPAANATR